MRAWWDKLEARERSMVAFGGLAVVLMLGWALGRLFVGLHDQEHQRRDH